MVQFYSIQIVALLHKMNYRNPPGYPELEIFKFQPFFPDLGYPDCGKSELIITKKHFNNCFIKNYKNFFDNIKLKFFLNLF